MGSMDITMSQNSVDEGLNKMDVKTFIKDIGGQLCVLCFSVHNILIKRWSHKVESMPWKECSMRFQHIYTSTLHSYQGS